MKDISKIFPRLYPILPMVGEPDLTLSPDDSPVEKKLAADITILYGYDQGSNYELISHRELVKMGLNQEQLHSFAVANLTATEKEIKLHRGVTHSMITCDGNLEAALLLHQGIWDYLTEEMGGEILASVPARDVLLIAGTKPEMVSSLKKKTCELIEHVSRPLSPALLTLTENGWKAY